MQESVHSSPTCYKPGRMQESVHSSHTCYKPGRMQDMHEVRVLCRNNYTWWQAFASSMAEMAFVVVDDAPCVAVIDASVIARCTFLC